MKINRLPALNYLDDKPVSEEDRKFEEAFCKGGLSLERIERAKYKIGGKWDRKNRECFEKMLEESRKDKEDVKAHEGSLKARERGDKAIVEEICKDVRIESVVMDLRRWIGSQMI